MSKAVAAHDQDKHATSHESEWEPEEGFQRNAFTVGSQYPDRDRVCVAAYRASMRSGAKRVTWREGLAVGTWPALSCSPQHLAWACHRNCRVCRSPI